MRSVLATIAFLLSLSQALAFWHGAASSSNPTFTALHTYFIAPAGSTPAPSDSNAGTLAAPLETPHHNVVCGDVIVAEAGSYTSQFYAGNWGADPALAAIDSVIAADKVIAAAERFGSPAFVAPSRLTPAPRLSQAEEALFAAAKGDLERISTGPASIHQELQK